MQEALVYEYAVIRIVPRPDREEFLNAGVILYCKRKKFLGALFHVDVPRFEAAFPKIEMNEILKNIKAFEGIAQGNTTCGPIARLEIDERFRWLTAVRSTIIQCSRPHPGLTTDPQRCLERILAETVL